MTYKPGDKVKLRNVKPVFCGAIGTVIGHFEQNDLPDFPFSGYIIVLNEFYTHPIHGQTQVITVHESYLDAVI